MTQQPPVAMGHGVKQRDLIRMTDAEIDAFLQGGRTMNCATINHDGTIHLVAMWYGFLDGCPALETKTKSQKVQNLRRNPQISCLIEDGDAYEELRGVELVGRGEILDDPARMLELGISVFERYQGIEYREELRPIVEQMLNKRVVVKIHVDRYVSWDHRKLRLPSTGAPQ
jgi:PPOX class probable F420-dependent enzyme